MKKGLYLCNNKGECCPVPDWHDYTNDYEKQQAEPKIELSTDIKQYSEHKNNAWSFYYIFKNKRYETYREAYKKYAGKLLNKKDIEVDNEQV